MTTRAGIYLRQSLDRQEGIERQRERTTQLATLRGWDVTSEYRDNDVSASKPRGPKTEWARLLRDAKAGRVDVVISVDLDRLLRSTADLLTLIESGLKVITVDGELDLSTADGEFRGTMLAGIARFETRRKSERQLRANAHRAAQGKVNPGRRKFGYKLGNREPMESEAQWVRWMFEQAQARRSIRSISLQLRAEGVSVGGGRDWTPRRVRETLLNRSYEGLTVYKGTWSHSEEVEPIVTPQQAAEVRAWLADPIRKTTTDSAVRHLASGVALCGVCGETMFYMRDYRCRHSASHPSIRKAKLDPLIFAALANAVFLAPQAQGRLDDNPSALAVELHEVREQRARLVSLVVNGLMTEAQAADDLRRIQGREHTLEARQREHEEEEVSSHLWSGIRRDVLRQGQVSVKDAVSVRRALRERIETLDLGRQRELTRTLLRVTVYPGRAIDRVKIEAA